MSSVALKPNTNFKIDPTQFTVWIFLVSVVMLFAGFTSAYIVRKAQGDWVNFELPSAFITSCIVVVISSLTMAGAQYAFKTGKIAIMRIALLTSLILGSVFIANQFAGWDALTANGHYLVGNASGSFLFIISGAHAVHVGAGLVALLVCLLRSFILGAKDIKSLKVNSVAIYWHFVGVLWLYIYIFLTNA